MSATTPSTTVSATKRLTSIDAYRGFVMFLMMAEVLALHRVAQGFPSSSFWAFLSNQQDHVEWVGCVLHDLIQPSFSFLVGTALAFSVASRMARGQSRGQMFLHAIGRSLSLILLGVFLRSVGHKETNWTFEDTLSQIGLGYSALFLIGTRSVRTQWISLGVILFGYWLLFALYPLPGPGFDWTQAGVAKDWDHHLTGFAAHWNKNTNAAWAFDRWFLNLFPRDKVWTNNGGGYSTLSFIPTLGTMVLGLIAGGWLRAPLDNKERLRRLVIAGVVGLALGWALNGFGICPNVKRIWTPGWTLFSGGWCFLLMATFYAAVDVKNHQSLAFPLTVIGMNSIAAYCIAHLWEGFLIRSFDIHLPSWVFGLFGAPFERTIHGVLFLLVAWLILFWMYRRKLFLRL